MAVEVPQNEETPGGGKDGGRKGVSYAIRQGGANRGGIHIEKRGRGGAAKRDAYPHIIRVGIKRRKRGCRKFRKRQALPDKNDYAATSMHGIGGENPRPGAGVIKAQSREPRNSKRGRGVKIGFLNADKVDRMGQKKTKQFSAPGSKTSSIHLKNPERIRGEKKQEVQKDSQEQGTVVGGQWEEIYNGQIGNKLLVKDAKLLLPLTEAMKIARLTSLLLDAPRQSLPRPRLRHGRRLASLSHLSLTLNLYALFFALSLALLPRLPPLLTFLTALPGNRLWSMPLI